MKKTPVIFLTVCSLSILLASCKKEDATNSVSNASATDRSAPTLPTNPYNYANLPLPAYLTGPNINGQINTPPNNQITDYGATLGRVLFYDKNLSANNTISCASCHQQAFSFSDPAVLSTGFNGGHTTRNAMSLLNAKYYPDGHFFWDERAASAEAQASRPIVNPVEMGMTMPGVVTKIQGLSYYPTLFKKAFGTSGIDSTRVVNAIAQFVRSMVSYRTKYDAGRAALPPNQNPGIANFSNFTSQENLGKSIFFGVGRCVTCHGTETFTSPAPFNNGLDQVYADNGVGAITGDPAQNGFFKAPSIRGIEKSAPYMHDGRFATLDQVVEHYNSQVKPHPNLAPQLRNPDGTPRRLNLSSSQKQALVAFLKTLTDTGIATDVKYSNPFQ
jgi:cytochrome c peroxidase